MVSDCTKWLFLNAELCMVRSTLIGINPAEITYYPLMTSLHRCTGSCNYLSLKICVEKKKIHKC